LLYRVTEGISDGRWTAFAVSAARWSAMRESQPDPIATGTPAASVDSSITGPAVSRRAAGTIAAAAAVRAFLKM